MGELDGIWCNWVQLSSVFMAPFPARLAGLTMGETGCPLVWHPVSSFVPTRSQGVKRCRSDLVALQVLFV